MGVLKTAQNTLKALPLIMQGIIALPSQAEAQEVPQEVANIASSAINQISDIRYVDDNKKVPESSEETMQTMQGDCKDIAEVACDAIPNSANPRQIWYVSKDPNQEGHAVCTFNHNGQDYLINFRTDRTSQINPYIETYNGTAIDAFNIGTNTAGARFFEAYTDADTTVYWDIDGNLQNIGKNLLRVITTEPEPTNHYENSLQAYTTNILPDEISTTWTNWGNTIVSFSQDNSSDDSALFFQQGNLSQVSFMDDSSVKHVMYSKGQIYRVEFTDGSIWRITDPQDTADMITPEWVTNQRR